ncbi:hypothetical protein L804_01241 [Cryptococcus deuterogattii 2001/935-1]|nr:hypothetical protein L804_01241 [Cryptococcus deuterogattii 2001/935-1]
MTFQPFSPWIPPSIASSSILQRSNFSTREEFLNNVPNSRSSTDSTWLNAQQYTKTLSPPPQDYSNWKAKGLSSTQPHEILPPKFSCPFLPGLDVGPWSPPATQHQGRGSQGKSTPDVEETLLQKRTALTGLKTAVKALTARFGVSDSSESSAILTKSIIDWAKPLCYTSCGNYLCQQLLERGTLEDKKAFLNQIRGRHQKLRLNLGPSLSKCNQEPVADALFKYGVYESMQTGARRLWREKNAVKPETWTFSKSKVNREMVGRWTDLACTNEILEDIAHISNNQFGQRTPGIVTIATSSIGKAHLNTDYG